MCLKSAGAFRENERSYVRCPSERDPGPNLEGIAESIRGLCRCEFYNRVKIVGVIGGTSRLVKLILEVS